MMHLTRSLGRATAVVAVVVGLSATGTAAAEATRADAQHVVTEATRTLEIFRTDKAYLQLSTALRDGRAVLIVPEYIRAGIGIGGEGGTGVLLRRDPQSRQWSYPAFYTIKSGSIGPQLGYEEARVIFVIDDDAMLDKVMKGEVTLGAEASVVAGSKGASTRSLATGDQKSRLHVFVQSAGAFAGATVKGGIVEANDPLNRAYYGSDASATQIVGKAGLTNPHADGLRAVLADIAGRNAARR